MRVGPKRSSSLPRWRSWAARSPGSARRRRTPSTRPWWSPPRPTTRTATTPARSARRSRTRRPTTRRTWTAPTGAATRRSCSTFPTTRPSSCWGRLTIEDFGATVIDGGGLRHDRRPRVMTSPCWGGRTLGRRHPRGPDPAAAGQRRCAAWHPELGNLVVRDSTFQDFRTPIGVDGAAILADGGSLSVTGSTFSRNDAGSGGAAIRTTGGGVVTNNTFYVAYASRGAGVLRRRRGHGVVQHVRQQHRHGRRGAVRLRHHLLRQRVPGQRRRVQRRLQRRFRRRRLQRDRRQQTARRWPPPWWPPPVWRPEVPRPTADRRGPSPSVPGRQRSTSSSPPMTQRALLSTNGCSGPPGRRLLRCGSVLARRPAARRHGPGRDRPYKIHHPGHRPRRSVGDVHRHGRRRPRRRPDADVRPRLRGRHSSSARRR